MATPSSSYSNEERLFANRYKQGGRTVFLTTMTPDQITNTIMRPDPDAQNPGNRRIDAKRAKEFAEYFIRQGDWVIPGIILRAPTIFNFEPNEAATEGVDAPHIKFGALTYPKRAAGDIHILDGQHRILGFHLATALINERIDKARNERTTARRVDPGGAAEALAVTTIRELEAVRDRFSTEGVPVEIQVTDDLQAYRQMFYDIAENAVGITGTVKARFDSRKAVNRALPIVLDHPLLRGRVDLESDRISMVNPNWISASQLVEIMRATSLGYGKRFRGKADGPNMEGPIAQKSKDFLDDLVAAFPVLVSLKNGQITPELMRKSTMLSSAFFVRILGCVEHSLIEEHAWTRAGVVKFFSKLAKHTNAPAHTNSIWKLHAAPEAFNLNVFNPNQKRQDAKALIDTMVGWALDDESFVNAEPLPAPPEPEVDPDAGIDFAPSLDTKAQAVQERLEMEEISKASKERAKSIKK